MKNVKKPYQNSQKMSFKDKRLGKFVPKIAVASMLCGLLSTPTVFAQEQSLVLEEIVVTARKRQESLQDVPIAITAFDAGAIERTHIDTVADLEKFVPNADFGAISFAGQALAATIRGIGFSDFEKSFEPAVGVSIDGVFQAFSTNSAIDSFDIESVEVLRGPQGTLFGRNTVGGVINITRSRPTEDSGLKLGTRFNNVGGEEFLLVANTGQIADSLSTKFYAFDKKDETFAVNRLTGTPDDQTDVTNYGAAFLYTPNDKFEALVSLDVFDDESQGSPIYNFNAPGDLFCFLPNAIFGFNPQNINVGCGSSSGDIALDSNLEVFTRAVPFVTTTEGTAFTSEINYQISDNLRLTSITGYREADEQLLNEGLGAPNVFLPVAPGIVVDFPLLFTNRVQDSEQFTQELRLAGEIGDNLTFVSGIYYLDAEYNLTGGEFPDGSFGTAQAFGMVSGNDTYSQTTEAFALFVDGTYQINDQFSISAGLRYSDETKDATRTFLLDPTNVISSGEQTASFDNVSGRFILQYDISENISAFGGYSRGFRSGGFNGRAQSVAVIGPYDEEIVDGFEGGIRAEFLGNRLRVNPTIFSYDYTDKQEENSVAVGVLTQTTVQNASEVGITGFELEVLGLVSPELTVRASLGLLDAEFDEFLIPDLSDPTGQRVIDVSDQRNLRSAPDSTFSIGATYVKPLFGGEAQIIFDASYNYQEDFFTSGINDPQGLGREITEGTEGADFSLTYQTLRDSANFKVTAYINDAFDDAPGRIATTVFVPGLFTFGIGQATQIYGIQAEVEF